MPVSKPFEDTKVDAQGDVPIAEEPKRRRRRSSPGGRLFAVHAAEGCFICGEEDLVKTMCGKTEAEVYLLEKKIKSISVVPGRRNLLTNESEKDSIEIDFE
jgi:hypothetical protein